MSDGAIDLKAEARAKAYAMPLEEINMADPELFRTDTMWPYFERLRKEDPVHYNATGHEDGPYWSVTRRPGAGGDGNESIALIDNASDAIDGQQATGDNRQAADDE